VSLFLKKHPFAVEAFFERSTVLAFAYPKEELTSLIPPCLELDCFDNRWGFLAVAMVQTKEMRPKGFPKFLGNNFFLMGYRIFVRYTDSRGKTRRGLYILKSQTDCLFMKWSGNLFTDYQYERVPMTFSKSDSGLRIQSSAQESASRFSVEVSDAGQEIPLPESSPFDNWQEARRFSGPMPFTFTYKKHEKKVIIIEGVRSHWKPKPLEVREYQIPFLDELSLNGGVLANAFMVEDVPYYWKKGVLDSWRGK